MNVEAWNDTSGNAGNVAADLVLIVEERPANGGRVFDVRLEVAPRWLPDLRHPTYGEISFKADPVHQLRHHLRTVGDASPREQNETAALAKTLRADGAHLSRKFLPDGIRKCLSTLCGQAVTLHIVSAAPWIPWELLRIERTPSNSRIDGPFLCEAFALTRGLPGRKCLPSHLPLTRIGVVMAANEQPRLPSLEREWAQMTSLGRPGEREIERIEARLVPLLEAFSRGEHDGWHFSTHATFKDEAPDFSAIALDSGEQLQPFHLAGESAALGLRKPLVFLNACSSGQTGLSLTGIGGLPAEFLNAGAGACIGTLWPIRDSCAATFAHTFYQEFLAGSPIGEAVRKARTAIRSEDDPTWLAYTVFAHPGAVCGAEAAPESPESPTVCEVEPFETQERAWDPVRSPPAALLRAEYGIVRFHWRTNELEELEAWCLGNVPLGVRLYTGPGGMGKTRLAIELARRLRDNGWQAGFFPRKDMAPQDAWRILQRRGGRMLLVIDYAETRRDILVPLLEEILREKRAGPVRVLLLARAALDWWENLKREGDGIGELLSGPATSRHHLGALAFSVPQRVDSFGIAMMDFAGRLHRPVPAKELETPDKPYFERALLLHMNALAAVEGVEVKDDMAILDYILDRERRHWQKRARKYGLEETLIPGIGRAMAAITLGGGAGKEQQAIEILSRFKFFTDQTYSVLTAISHLLRETYPNGGGGIEPIMPDLLGEHLIQREMEAGANELLEIVLGPAGPQGGPQSL